MSTCILVRRQHRGQHIRSVVTRVDLYWGKIPFFYPLSKPMVSPLGMLRSRVVGGILSKMDDTRIVLVELEFLLPNLQLSNEILHPNDLLATFNSSHVLRFFCR